ncbi:hypothetical protein ABZ372_46690, partial [Streptomyces sp. NPDC005921]
VKRAPRPDIKGSPKTALGYALLEAGLIPQLPFDSRATGTNEIENFTVVEELTALVMVAGQFGLSVPLELLLRATGEPGYFNVARLFDEVDLVRWEEDHEGNFRLGARSRLEARLIVTSRLGDTAREATYAERLIVEARGSDYAISGAREIDFVADLVRAMGAQGTESERYRKEFPLISGALRKLREERGLENPRLILQEANLLREFTIWSRNNRWKDGAYDSTQTVVALQSATEILHTALGQFRPDAQSPLRSKLRVELATAYATQAEVMRTEHRAADQIAFFEQAKQELALAREEDQESFYPLDVLAWSTRNVLGSLSDEERSEAIVDVLSAFETLSPEDLDPSQVENYHKRHQEFATEANNLTLAEEAFQALAERGSGAGVYLRARAIADPTALRERLDSAAQDRISDALTYLGTHEELVSGDSRCLNLRLDLWWLHNTGKHLFSGERECLPFNQDQWQEVLRLIAAIEDTGRTYRDIPLTFIRGIAEFHRGELGAAFSTFSDLETRSDEVRGRRRIIRSYLASDSHGNPQLFNGEIARLTRDLRRGEVYVESLRRSVNFIPSEFRGRDLRRGANLGSFHIGFNLLGIIADPEPFLHTRRQER